MPNETLRYTRTAQWLHWIMALIIIGAWVLGFYLSGLPRGPEKSALIQWHKAIGSTVVVLVAIRLAWRAGHRPPPLPESMAPWQRAWAHGAHWLLYVLMLAQPLSGWAMSSARGFPVALAGLIPLPPMAAKDETLAKSLTEWHGLIGWALAILVLGHVAMALKHRFVDRDDVLIRMLPWRQ